jgi:hypothetical protein
MSHTAWEASQPLRRTSRDWFKWFGCLLDNPLWRFILSALAVKAIILFADPSPQLFLGDSGSYIYTALTGWIPPDRSFLYGFLIRWLSVGSGSLFSLVLGQTLASAISAGLLGWIMWRFIGTSTRFAMLAAILYSLDPLQLMYERFVMAEAFSLLAAMMFVSFILLFVEGGRKRYLILASFAGLLAVALRISFLPAVAALSFSAPIIRFLCKTHDQTASTKARWKELSISLTVVFICHFSLHNGYKLLNGRLSGASPAYQYSDGFSLLASWCPLLVPSDLQATGVSERILAGTAPRTLESRRGQRWLPKGIDAAFDREYGDPVKANALAKKTAFQIVRRDPIGVALLALRTYLRGWQRAVIRSCIIEDTGARRPVPPDLTRSIARSFHIAIDENGNQKTLTKAYFRQGAQWYRMLLLTPLLLVFTTAFAQRRHRPFVLVVTIYAGVALLTAVGLAVDNSIRYLHPLGWAFFIFVAIWLQLATKRQSKTAPALQNLREGLL